MAHSIPPDPKDVGRISTSLLSGLSDESDGSRVSDTRRFVDPEVRRRARRRVGKELEPLVCHTVLWFNRPLTTAKVSEFFLAYKTRGVVSRPHFRDSKGLVAPGVAEGDGTWVVTLLPKHRRRGKKVPVPLSLRVL